MEVVILGAVFDLGRKFGIVVPRNETLYNLIKSIEGRKGGTV